MLRLVPLVVVFALFFGGGAVAAPVVKGQYMRDYARITFEWPQKTEFSYRSEGNRLILEFDRPAAGNFSNALGTLTPYVQKIDTAASGKTVILTLDQPYKARTFISGNLTGVDLLGIDMSRRGEKPAASPVSSAVSPEELPDKLPEKSGKNPAAGKKNPDPLGNVTPILKPQSSPPVAPAESAAADSAPSVPPPPAPAPEQQQVAAPANTVAEPQQLPPPPETQEAEEVQEAEKLTEQQPDEDATPEAEHPVQEPSAEAAPAEEHAAQESPAEDTATTHDAPEPQQETAITVPSTPPSGPLVVTAERNEWGVKLLFPWQERTAAAVFLRGPYLWVVFNAEAELDISQLTQSPASSYIRQVQKLPVKGHTVLHLTTQGMADAIVDKPQGTEEWSITLSSETFVPRAPVQVQHNTAPPLKPHFFLPILQTSELLKLRDPLIGDRLMIIPLYRPGVGVSPGRSTVEFNLLKSSQGVAIEPLTDHLRTAMLRNGLKIATPEGLQLSDDMPAIANDKPDTSVSGSKTFFPYAEWKTENREAFFARRQQLLEEASQGNEQATLKARLDLARLYLGEGLASEALGILDTIRSDNLNFYLGSRAAALHGAANFLLLRIGEAARDFSSMELDGLAETDLWRDILDTVQRKSERGFDYLDYEKNYIGKYPPRLRQKLAVIAADRYVANQQPNKAIKVFEGLSRDHLLEPVSKEMNYMVGEISAQTGQIANAIQLWEKLANEQNPDRFIRARAEFALVNLLLKENEITLDDAIKRLDRLRIVWRGDGLEMALLAQLGSLYLKKEDFINSLRAYRELVTYFPNHPDRLEITQTMSDMFARLFNGGGADKLQPLDALSLYYEFRELTPLEEEGDRMIRNLADRLASVDLLDRAAALLQHQVRFRLSGEERSRVGARLAVLHLLNREPEKALDVLKVTGYGLNPAELDQERRRLTARALADLKKYDRAYQVIEDDFTPEALALKQELFWETQDWPNLIALAEEQMGNREDPSAPLKDEETETLIRLAVAYMFQREYGQLKYLNDYFTPLLPKEGTKREMFAYITGDSGPVDHENIANITRDIANIQSFMTKYRERIENMGLSSVVQ